MVKGSRAVTDQAGDESQQAGKGTWVLAILKVVDSIRRAPLRIEGNGLLRYRIPAVRSTTSEATQLKCSRTALRMRSMRMPSLARRLFLEEW